MIVHLVTDRRRLVPTSDVTIALAGLQRQITQAIAAGVDVIQIREPDLESGALFTAVADAVRRSRCTTTRIVVNDRLDVALAAGADGIHLPSRSLPPAVVRSVTPAGFLIGRSIHGSDELQDVTAADYVIAGTVWPSKSKPAGHVCLGIDGLRDLVTAAAVPVLAIGGVSATRLAEVAATGAAGVAAIGLFLDDEANRDAGTFSLNETVRAARRRFDAAVPVSHIPRTPAHGS